MYRLALFLFLLPLAPTLAAEIVAHRGASHDAPENTLPALQLAWEQKADASELDIHQTKDGRIIVCHDADTKRTTGTPGRIAERTLAELRQLDAGAWKGPKFVGAKLPTLDEMLAAVPADKKLYVEVKCGPEVVDELNRLLRASGLKPTQTPVISFDRAVIAAMKRAQPEVPAYWLVDLKPKEGRSVPSVQTLIEQAKALQANGLDVSVGETVDASFVTAVKAAGLRLDVWTVDDPVVARRLVKWGVDGITTNRPQWLREQLAK